MPKVTMEFNLPEENNEFKLAQRGSDYHSFLWELAQEVRGFLKYGHKLQFTTTDDVLEWVKNKLSEAEIWDIE